MKRFYPAALAALVAVMATMTFLMPDRIAAHNGNLSSRAVYPNPFTEGTTFELTMPRQAKIKIDVYNIRGQHIRNLYGGEAGEIHPPTQGGQPAPIDWDGKDAFGEPVPPGIYICVLQSEGVTVRSVKVIKLEV